MPIRKRTVRYGLIGLLAMLLLGAVLLILAETRDENHDVPPATARAGAGQAQ